MVRASLPTVGEQEGQIVLHILGTPDERESIQSRIAEVATGLTSRPTRSVDLRESRAYEFVIEGSRNPLTRVLIQLGATAEQINEARRNQVEGNRESGGPEAAP